MTECIIDVLEIVRIHKEQRSLSLRIEKESFELLKQIKPVRQIAKRVIIGKMLQTILIHLQFMDICNRACHPIGMSLIVIKHSATTHEPPVISIFETKAIFTLEHAFVVFSNSFQFAHIPIRVFGMY
ncbi:hypothetical protein D1872_219830 [compost metagenome]